MYIYHIERNHQWENTLFIVAVGNFYFGWLLALFNEKTWPVFTNSPAKHTCSSVPGGAHWLPPIASYPFPFLYALLSLCTGSAALKCRLKQKHCFPKSTCLNFVLSQDSTFVWLLNSQKWHHDSVLPRSSGISGSDLELNCQRTLLTLTGIRTTSCCLRYFPKAW